MSLTDATLRLIVATTPGAPAGRAVPTTGTPYPTSDPRAEDLWDIGPCHACGAEPEHGCYPGCESNR